mgnify:CR=1 FL=1
MKEVYNMEKENLIAQIKEILPVTKKLEGHLENLSQIENYIANLDAQINAPRKFNLFTDVAIGAIVIPTILINVVAKVLTLQPATVGKMYFFFMIAGGVLNFYVSGKIRDKGKDGARRDRTIWQKKYEEAEENMLKDIAPDWDKVLSVIPRDYATPTCIYSVYNYLVNGRADTLKEALNLFEEEQHRWRVEANQQKMYDEYQQELQTMKDVQASMEARVANAEWMSKVAYLRSTQQN